MNLSGSLERLEPTRRHVGGGNCMIAGVSVDAGGQVEIDQDIVVRQLDRLLESSDFQAPSRLKKFLEFVVQETLKGRAGSV